MGAAMWEPQRAAAPGWRIVTPSLPGFDGRPLVADTTYGGTPALGLQRQALHAARLSFVHPTSLQAMQFATPPPPDFDAAWQLIA